ncbi:MAG: bacteriohopanetetrol glucosamine biosynthesis glycosyltransferase HpnI [Candidatus Velthaea sp.]
MRVDARRCIELLAGAAACGALAYAAFALDRVRAFGRRAVPSAGAAQPPISVLKPLRGSEPQLAENLRSFCRQDYADFEVIFGARDPDDAALPIARDVAREFPGRARTVSGDGPRFVNPKIDTLGMMLPHAAHGVLVIADSDMRVEPDYLRAVIAPFGEPHVGAVTCLYRGTPLGGAVSTLAAMRADEHFAASVLVAEALGPLRFCFGSTMAVRRTALEGVGGLAALGWHLADDALLGELLSNAGWRVVLSPYVVENVVVEPTLWDLCLHELRWARTNRMLRPAGYALLFLTYPIPLAVLYAAVSRRPHAAAVLAAAFALRFALARAARRTFGVRGARAAWLVPVRDVLGLALWAGAYATRDVRWRAERLTTAPDGRITSRA